MQMSGQGCWAEAPSAAEVMVFKVQIPEQVASPGNLLQFRFSGQELEGGAGTALQRSLLHTQAETGCANRPKNESEWEMGWRLT